MIGVRRTWKRAPGWRAGAVIASALVTIVLANLSGTGARASTSHQLRASVISQTSPDSAARIIADINAERTANRIPPVTLSGSLSTGCRLLDEYEHLHGDNFVHDETPGSAGYTPQGNAVAQAGPLLDIDGGSSVTGWGNNPYEFGPNHLFNLLNPRRTIMGADDSVFQTVGGSLVEEICVITATSSSATTTDAVYTYPGDGAMIYPSETASEDPETPGQTVGIPEGTTTGPYLLVFAEGPFQRSTATITNASLVGPDGPVKLDIVERKLNAGAFLIPTSPLANLATYHAEVTFDVSGTTLVHTWSFTTNADASTATGATGPGTTTVSNATRQELVVKIMLYGQKAVFEINPYLPHPIVSWQLIFGDGLSNQGPGNPPHFAGHTYKPGSYRAVLTLHESGGQQFSSTEHVTIP